MSELDVIIDPATVRARTARIYEAALGGATHFAVHPEAMGRCVELVLKVTREQYPKGDIPVHGRFEHLKAGGIDRVARVLSKLSRLDSVEQGRALVDLTVVSVLLDAGAGPTWKYVEDGVGYSRSEGLAVASAAMFEAGLFSHDGSLSVTALGLRALSVDAIAKGMQVGPQNPLDGLEGRAALLTRLADALESDVPRFGPTARPGGLVDALSGHQVPAPALLKHLLLGFSRMWPARVTCEGVGFGDVWPYRGEGFSHWVPFHKLSQWLTYSLLEPLAHAGVQVTQVEHLTGLPEYRNGGLFLDTGVLSLRDPALATRQLEARDEAIIEWRALTVQLLDQVGDAVRAQLGKTSAALPLAKVLQGGTWAAGRRVAAERRAGGGPPLTLKSDGTVF